MTASNGTEQEPVLYVHDLTFSYPDGRQALRGVTMHVDAGEKVALVGPNGAGKSTLMLHFNGILKGSAGRIRVDGMDVVKENLGLIRAKVGLVFQNPDDQLFSTTVFDDVAFGPLHMGYPEAEVRRRVQRALGQVGIVDFAPRMPHHLSVGERKRAAIATVLAMDPSILVLDEPTAGLDPRGRRSLITLLRELDATMLVSTHDMALVPSFSPAPSCWTAAWWWPTGPRPSLWRISACWRSMGWRRLKSCRRFQKLPTCVTIARMEIEAKFSLPDRATFDRLLQIEALAGCILSPARLKRVHDRYLDTASGGFLAGGYACRVRVDSAGGRLLTLKSLTPAQGLLHQRQEFEVSLPAQVDLDPAALAGLRCDRSGQPAWAGPAVDAAAGAAPGAPATPGGRCPRRHPPRSSSALIASASTPKPGMTCWAWRQSCCPAAIWQPSGHRRGAAAGVGGSHRTRSQVRAGPGPGAARSFGFDAYEVSEQWMTRTMSLNSKGMLTSRLATSQNQRPRRTRRRSGRPASSRTNRWLRRCARSWPANIRRCWPTRPAAAAARASTRCMICGWPRGGCG
jgi:cobalt/nickel transport system ATP-binding protein